MKKPQRKTNKQINRNLKRARVLAKRVDADKKAKIKLVTRLQNRIEAEEATDETFEFQHPKGKDYTLGDLVQENLVPENLVPENLV